ncbi:MAG: 23S rRNA (adenine(2503)-C(2))-methyltransferase RlmN, partial [Defluviitaleaceae bacterium]|nr:23S rRNA (adenine(2503)-C(2))-methyltransferase RlmN [Defluviitaleaceae bacterium]
MIKIDIRSADLPALEALVQQLGEKKFRASQIFEWIHGKFAESFDTMTNLPQQFRDRLADHAYFSKVEIIQTQISKDSTKKFLFMLESCGMIE